MGELERLKDRNPYKPFTAPHLPEDLRRQEALFEWVWELGVQAAWDAGWRPVPSEEELRKWIIERIFVNNVPWLDWALQDAQQLRQWLLERGNDA